jgi:AmmeMemoRadiSam system radical SAM enzyme
MPTEGSSLAELLARRTREGELYETLPDRRVRCYACGHRCLIPPGRDGVCRVRFNDAGTLRVPYGYVGGLQVDPVEKKPFFHALPGARALSFGMLGCDLHCSYCFVPGTEVVTTGGLRTLESLFAGGHPVLETGQDAVALRPSVDVVTHLGRSRPVRGVFRHQYRGPLMVLTLSGGTEIHATPEHEFLVSARAARGVPPPSFFVPASAVTPEFDLLEPAADGRFRKRRLEETRVQAYEGPVYNIEVEEDRTYLVQGAAVHNCQNWVTSQALRDPQAVASPQEVTPQELVRLARRHQARILTSTYNEPLITSEWAVAVFREARRAGLVCSYVSNGNATDEVLDYIRPYVSLYKVDLKSFRDRHYRELGGTLEAVLRTIQRLHETGFWVEIVTLLVPGFNDSVEELAEVARFLVSVSPDLPWHVTAFHRDYKMTGPDNTPAATLIRAAEIGAGEGLRFVYAGNLPGRVGPWENTYCPGCRATLVERTGFHVLVDRVSETGSCPECRRAVPGFWEPEAAELGTGLRELPPAPPGTPR